MDNFTKTVTVPYVWVGLSRFLRLTSSFNPWISSMGETGWNPTLQATNHLGKREDHLEKCQSRDGIPLFCDRSQEGTVFFLGLVGSIILWKHGKKSIYRNILGEFRLDEWTWLVKPPRPSEVGIPKINMISLHFTRSLGLCFSKRWLNCFLPKLSISNDRFNNHDYSTSAMFRNIFRTFS